MGVCRSNDDFPAHAGLADNALLGTGGLQRTHTVAGSRRRDVNRAAPEIVSRGQDLRRSLDFRESRRRAW